MASIENMDENAPGDDHRKSQLYALGQAMRTLRSSSQDSQEKKENDPRKNMLSRRSKLMKELSDTEITYVSHLALVNQFFIQPLKKAAKSPNPILTDAEISMIFSNLTTLLESDKEFVKELASRMKNAADDTPVGDLFLSGFEDEFASTYKQYITNFPRALIMLENFSNQKKGRGGGHPFNAFRQKQQQQPAMMGLDLNALLVTPVQRIPRYVLLLKDILKHTPEDHKDFTICSNAYKRMCDLADEINLHKGIVEDWFKLEYINDQFLIRDQETMNLCRYDRRILLETFTEEKGKRKKIFVFNDMLLVADPIASTLASNLTGTTGTSNPNKLKLNYMIDLVDATIKEKPVDRGKDYATATSFVISENSFSNVFPYFSNVTHQLIPIDENGEHRQSDVERWRVCFDKASKFLQTYGSARSRSKCDRNFSQMTDAAVSVEDWKLMMAGGSILKSGKNHVVVSQKIPSSHLYYVDSGMMKVQRSIGGKHITIQTLNGGDWFGEISMIGRLVSNKIDSKFTLKSSTDCAVFSAEFDRLDQLLSRKTSQTEPENNTEGTTSGGGNNAVGGSYLGGVPGGVSGGVSLATRFYYLIALTIANHFVQNRIHYSLRDNIGEEDNSESGTNDVGSSAANNSNSSGSSVNSNGSNVSANSKRNSSPTLTKLRSSGEFNLNNANSSTTSSPAANPTPADRSNSPLKMLNYGSRSMTTSSLPIPSNNNNANNTNNANSSNITNASNSGNLEKFPSSGSQTTRERSLSNSIETSPLSPQANALISPRQSRKKILKDKSLSFSSPLKSNSSSKLKNSSNAKKMASYSQLGNISKSSDLELKILSKNNIDDALLQSFECKMIMSKKKYSGLLLICKDTILFAPKKSASKTMVFYKKMVNGIILVSSLQICVLTKDNKNPVLQFSEDNSVNSAYFILSSHFGNEGYGKAHHGAKNYIVIESANQNKRINIIKMLSNEWTLIKENFFTKYSVPNGKNVFVEGTINTRIYQVVSGLVRLTMRMSDKENINHTDSEDNEDDTTSDTNQDTKDTNNNDSSNDNNKDTNNNSDATNNTDNKNEEQNDKDKNNNDGNDNKDNPANDTENEKKSSNNNKKKKCSFMELKPGGLFGEEGFLLGGLAPYTAKAVTNDTCVVFMDRSRLIDVANKHPDKLGNFFKYIAHWERLKLIKLMKVEEREVGEVKFVYVNEKGVEEEVENDDDDDTDDTSSVSATSVRQDSSSSVATRDNSVAASATNSAKTPETDRSAGKFDEKVVYYDEHGNEISSGSHDNNEEEYEIEYEYVEEEYEEEE